MQLAMGFIVPFGIYMHYKLGTIGICQLNFERGSIVRNTLQIKALPPKQYFKS